MYETESARLIVVKSRLSPEAWEERVREARKAERTMKAVQRRVERGMSVNKALAESVPPSKQSWGWRKWRAYEAQGWEGLIDGRKGREPKVTTECEDVVIAARLA